ncbi:hypothetical protein BO71DRAFT_399788, partial [Aspergillus ellipticus CBS 707.79]
TDDSFSDAPPKKPAAQPATATRRRAARRTRDQALQDLRASLPRESVEAYSEFLAQSIDHAPDAATAGGGNYNATQDGIVTWTPKEKEVLYHVLDRKGRDGIAEISRQIGTKSELEVQEHLKLLHRGLERQHLKARHTRTVILGDVPAAAEIGKRCCDALDSHARLVALEEQEAEDVAGKQKHHNLWIIDQTTAEDLGDRVKQQGVDPSANSSAHLTADLLNMEKWIRLSERCFMNFGGARLEDNWVNVAFAGETPSVTADAFADFYALAVSITRRLVQSALFFASSRLRNMRETGNQKACVVRARDVKTALDVLNMKRDRSDYWPGLARRCCLRVEDSRHLKGWKAVHLEHYEVEEILSGKMNFDSESERSVSRGVSRGRAQDRDTDAEDAADSDAGFEPSSPASSVPSSPMVSSNEQEQPVDAEDDHAEQVDQRTSRLEEADLWKLIGRSPPHNLEGQIRTGEAQDVPQRRPAGERKTKEELVDWRNRTLYRNEWEEFGEDFADLYEDISENRRKRRRLDEPTQSTSMNDDVVNDDSAADQVDNPDPDHPAREKTKENDMSADDYDYDSAVEQMDESPRAYDSPHEEEMSAEDYDESAPEQIDESPLAHGPQDRANDEMSAEGYDEYASEQIDSPPVSDHPPDYGNDDKMSVDETPGPHIIQATPEEGRQDESPTSALASHLIRHLESGQSGSWRTPHYAESVSASSDAISTPTRTRRRNPRPDDEVPASVDDQQSERVPSSSEDDYEDEVPLYSHGVSPIDSASE